MGEAELKAMSDKELTLLEKLLSEYIASCLIAYVKNPMADKECVARVKQFLGKSLVAIQNNERLEALDVVDTINHIGDYTLNEQINNTELREKLRKIEELLPTCMLTLPARSQEVFKEFDELYRSTLLNMPEEERTWPNILALYNANKIVLYQRNERPHYFISTWIKGREYLWNSFKHGYDYREYCDQKGIPENMRYIL